MTQIVKCIPTAFNYSGDSKKWLLPCSKKEEIIALLALNEFKRIHEKHLRALPFTLLNEDTNLSALRPALCFKTVTLFFLKKTGFRILDCSQKSCVQAQIMFFLVCKTVTSMLI